MRIRHSPPAAEQASAVVVTNNYGEAAEQGDVRVRGPTRLAVIPNEDVGVAEQGKPIMICPHLRASRPVIWPTLCYLG